VSPPVIPAPPPYGSAATSGSFGGASGFDYVSSCPESILKFENGTVLGTGRCFYGVTPLPKSRAYSVELDARLLEGNGYGIWFHGQYDKGQVRAIGVQYDCDAGGLKFLNYPDTVQAFSFAQTKCDNNWHHWRLVSVGTSVSVHIDNVEVLHQTHADDAGNQFGFRTWGGRVELKNIKLGQP
jgi:3-keto-disaccharide hydrolase